MANPPIEFGKKKAVELTDMDSFFIQTMLKDAMVRAMDDRNAAKGDVHSMQMVVDLWAKVAQ